MLTNTEISRAKGSTTIDGGARTRSPFSFDLRTLMLLMTLAAIWMAWIGYPMYLHRRQEATRQLFEANSSEGKFVRTPDGWITQATFYGSADAPLIRAGKLADFPHLQELTLRHSGTRLSNFQNADLAGLRDCKELRQIYLTGQQLDHRAIAELRSLLALDTLYVDHTSMGKVTGEFAALQKLKKLSITSSELTDAHLESLQELKELEEIRLGGNKLTDSGIAKLAHMQNLKTIDLTFTSASDQSLQKLTRLSELTDLQFTAAKVTGDFGLQAGDWPKLRKFVAINTPFNDQGLARLANCKALEFVDLGDTEITPEALLEFVQNLPRLRQLSLSIKNAPPETVKMLAGHATLQSLLLRGKYEGIDFQELADSMPQKCEIHIDVGNKRFTGHGSGRSSR